jgi:fructose-1,6-bisphosphatase/inositol monophosphatase family enzyme
MKSVIDREIMALMREVTEKAILPRYRKLGDGDVHDKGDSDPVTVADHEAEEMLTEGLRKISPDHAIVGEEAAHKDDSVLEGLSGTCWIVDPIDGTRNFANGQEPFGILIALAVDGVAESGWIFDCVSGRFCAAHRKEGAYIDGERFTARESGEDPPIAAVSLLFMDDAKRAAVTEHIAPHYRLTDIPYCAAEQYPRLGLGINDVSIFERTLPWDHAAGVLWLNEAGGKAARADGSPYLVNEWERKGLIGASSPRLWDELAAQMATLA